MQFLKKIKILKKILSIILNKKKIIQSIKLIKMLYLNQYTRYPSEVIKLENKFSQYLGTKYSLSFCNGTSAFEASLFALSLKKGDEVIVCGMSFQSVVLTALKNGVKIKYLDMDNNLNLVMRDSDISKNTRALIICHWFGYPQNMDLIMRFIKRHKIFLIEDCSHSHGAEFDKKKLGSFGDVSFFSLQGDKAIAAGEGGISTTNKKELFNKMLLYGHFGRDLKDIKVDPFFQKNGFGRKLRMHPFAAALALVDLNTLDSRNKKIIEKIEKIQISLEKFKLFTFIEINKKSKIGGFHIGLPLWVNTKSKVSKILSYSEFFKEYPYSLYFKYDELDNGSKYLKFINQQLPVFLSKKNNYLTNIEKAKNKLVFLRLNIIQNYDYYKNDLENILGSIN